MVTGKFSDLEGGKEKAARKCHGKREGTNKRNRNIIRLGERKKVYLKDAQRFDLGGYAGENGRSRGNQEK